MQKLLVFWGHFDMKVGILYVHIGEPNTWLNQLQQLLGSQHAESFVVICLNDKIQKHLYLHLLGNQELHRVESSFSIVWWNHRIHLFLQEILYSR